jgi:hypothetical protein
MNISTPTNLQTAHYSSPIATYTKLMKSSTRLHPLRQPYVPMRIVNDVYGKAINRELLEGYSRINECMARKDDSMARRWNDTKKQTIDIMCDRLYL